MDAWWFRIGYLALFLIFFFVFRHLFIKWRRQVLQEQLLIHNMALARERGAAARIDMDENYNRRQVDEDPPDFETAVKYSEPVSYVEIDIPPPTYDSLNPVTTDLPNNHGNNAPALSERNRSENITSEYTSNHI